MFGNWIRAVCLGAMLSLCASEARAQVMHYPPGSFYIGGAPFYCGNATVTVVQGLGDLGRAAPGQYLLLDASLTYYPLEVIGFVFAHECAHFLGIMNEDAADAWAITTGRQQYWITSQGVEAICASVYFSPGDWTHFPGPVRCERLRQYFYTY